MIRFDTAPEALPGLINGMQAVILVGGQGTRLRPLTLTTPKPLVPLANRPVIEHIVAWLERSGVTSVFLATQYQAVAFERWLRRWRGVPVHTAEEPEPRGTAGAVAHIADLLHDTTIIVNGDNIIDLDVAVMLAAHRAAGAVATISTDTVDDPTGRGVVVSDHQGRVHVFQEKPAPGTALADTVNTGVYVLEPAAIVQIPRNTFCNFEQHVFPELVAADAGVHAFQSAHIWIDTGTPAGYLRAQDAVLAGIASTPAGVRDAEQGLLGSASEHIWRDESVTIDSAASLRQGVAIGFGTAIASGVTVTASSIGRECHILPNVQISRSALWDGCQVEQNAAIGNSIIGYNCYIGAGVQLDAAVIGDGCNIRAGTTVPAGTTLQPNTTYPA